MKKVVIIMVSAIIAAALFSGCATYVPSGIVYTGTKAGIAAGEGGVSHGKVGTATAKSIMGLVAWGDASIQTAAQNGGITQIRYVDYEVENILGIYGKYTTIVYGE
jgi:hypothetical protein